MAFMLVTPDVSRLTGWLNLEPSNMPLRSVTRVLVVLRVIGLLNKSGSSSGKQESCWARRPRNDERPVHDVTASMQLMSMTREKSKYSGWDELITHRDFS